MFDTIGSTADEVAAALRAGGFKGLPNTVGILNPLVKYAVTQVKEDAMMVDVIKAHALTITRRDWTRKEIPLPRAVQDFLARFNRGEYPDLVLDSSSK
jgi:hypothetical protein